MNSEFLAKFLRFVTIGALCAILFFALNYLLLTFLRLGIFFSLLLTYAICFFPGYLLQKRLAFRSTSLHRRSLPRYFLLHLGIFFLIYYFTINLEDFVPNSRVGAPLVATFFCGLFSFLISLSWVFSESPVTITSKTHAGQSTAKSLNAQYNLARPDSIAIRIANRMRFQMYERFSKAFQAVEGDKILDVGVTSDRDYESSNYFEAKYPFKHRVTALGIDDASFLEMEYPGIKFLRGSALDLPFVDGYFEYVHSSAVLEHVGSFENQKRMIEECLRVAAKGVFLTTPNRWFPIEFHTQTPLLHWLPKPLFRRILFRLGHDELSQERNLNLMSRRDLRAAWLGINGWDIQVQEARLLGLSSNLIVIAKPARIRSR